MFVAVYSGMHVVGGSNIGCKFLRESRSYIPHSFLGYVLANSGMYVLYMSDGTNFVFYASAYIRTYIYVHIIISYVVPISVDHSSSSKDVLRKEVESLFNQLYGTWHHYY